MYGTRSYDAQGLSDHPSLKIGIEFPQNRVPEESMRNPIFGLEGTFSCRFVSLSDKSESLDISDSLELGSA